MSLRYQTIGLRADAPLVFIHGLGGGADRTVSALATLKNRYVIAPDMPGHGESQGFSLSDLSFDHFADLVIALMDDLGIESCDIGGLSMGSGITLNLATRYPERAQKIILLRPSWLQKKKPEHLKIVAHVGQWIEQYGVQKARTKLLADPDFQKLSLENPPVAVSIDVMFQRPITATSTAVLYKMWQDSPFSDPAHLTTLKHPALIMTSPHDELHPQSIADVIAAHLPHAQSAELPPRYHEPKAYSLALCAIVQKFLAN